MGSDEIKLIDFGSACFENRVVYSYIQSRFYRSPEVVLGTSYNVTIDMWSLGCVAAELFLGLPLFPGETQAEEVTEAETQDETRAEKVTEAQILDEAPAQTQADAEAEAETQAETQAEAKAETEGMTDAETWAEIHRYCRQDVKEDWVAQKQ